MKELVILSGKGGTGKTSLTASFARLAHRPVLAEVGFHRIVAEPYEAGDGWNTRIQARTMRLVACARCGIEMGD